HGRQSARFDIFRGNPVRLMIFGQRLVFLDVGDANENGLALRREFRRIRKLARQLLRRQRQHRYGQQKSCPAKGIDMLSQWNLPVAPCRVASAEGRSLLRPLLPCVSKAYDLPAWIQSGMIESSSGFLRNGGICMIDGVSPGPTRPREKAPRPMPR